MLSKERLQERFIEMVKIFSPSKNEKEMCEWICKYLSDRNIEYKMDNAGKKYGGNGGNIVAYIKGNSNEMPICFAAHMDQIEPCKDVNPVINGDIISSDGTTTLGGDDKGGITAILEAVEDILETNASHRDIYLLFTVSEEISMMGAKNMDLSMLPCKDIVIVDAAGDTGTIAYKAPALEAINCTFYGKKAHAGIEPEKGINAIVAASHAISKMHIGRIDEETTSNIGQISGGGATNIVTDEVSFTAEIRSHSMEKLKDEVEHMEKCCENAAKLMNTTYKFEHEIAYTSMELDLNSELYKLTKDATEKEGIKPNTMVIGGGSDANVMAHHGYRSAIISVGMKDVHTVNESIDMNEVFKATKIIRRMMSNSQE